MYVHHAYTLCQIDLTCVVNDYTEPKLHEKNSESKKARTMTIGGCVYTNIYDWLKQQRVYSVREISIKITKNILETKKDE